MSTSPRRTSRARTAQDDPAVEPDQPAAVPDQQIWAAVEITIKRPGNTPLIFPANTEIRDTPAGWSPPQEFLDQGLIRITSTTPPAEPDQEGTL
jgi:hypothetical protein